jgi:hypothetical protein
MSIDDVPSDGAFSCNFVETREILDYQRARLIGAWNKVREMWGDTHGGTSINNERFLWKSDIEDVANHCRKEWSW